MAKRFELRKIWGIGPFKRRRVLSSFEYFNVAEQVMIQKLLTARRRGKFLHLEIVNTTTNDVIKEGKSK